MCARLSFRLFYAHKQFRSRFVVLVENVPDLKQLLKDVFVRNEVQSVWGSFTIFLCFKKKETWFNQFGVPAKLFKENDLCLDHFCWRFYQEIVGFVMLTKCCNFAIKTESWLLSKLFISSVSGEYRNFWEKFGFLSFSVIVTLVDSRDGLVEPLLWSFVIAPLLSFSLNFCKGTITVIVWNQNTVAMQCLQFG